PASVRLSLGPRTKRRSAECSRNWATSCRHPDKLYDPAESEGCCSSWNRKATTRPDSNSETSAAFDLRAEGSVCIGCAFRDRLRPSERPNRNGHWFGSSVLKCEAWDFSLFCRSRSFC